MWELSNFDFMQNEIDINVNKDVATMVVRLRETVTVGKICNEIIISSNSKNQFGLFFELVFTIATVFYIDN